MQQDHGGSHVLDEHVALLPRGEKGAVLHLWPLVVQESEYLSADIDELFLSVHLHRVQRRRQDMRVELLRPLRSGEIVEIPGPACSSDPDGDEVMLQFRYPLRADAIRLS